MTPNSRKYPLSILKAFRDEVQHKGIRDIRISAAISSVAFLLFNILDRTLYPDQAVFFLKLRLFVLAGNAVITLFTLIPSSYKISRSLKMAAYLVYAASIIIMVHMTGGYTSPYYAGLNIVLIGFMFLLPLDGLRTIIVCIMIYAGYLVPILIQQDIVEIDVFLNNNFFLITTMILAIASSYLSSGMHIKEFAARHSLASANKELKKLDRMKTEFFANVSHEVRTPLTSIIAPLQSIRQGDIGTVTADQTELLDQMHRNAIRLLDLINQMLDFSKLEAGKVLLRLSSVNLSEYTEDMVSLFREVSARKGLTLDFEPGERTDRPIFVDCDRYERIITNLIRNALKFTESGGLTISLKRRNDSMTVIVADTGIGIPESHLSKIFNRFEQVDSTSTRQHEGTGLGLAIVEESVQLMHGTIKVESVLDIGTVFTVTIPTNLTELEPHAFVERRQSDRRNRASEWSSDDRRSSDRRKRDYSRIPVSELAAVESQTYSAAEQEKRTQEEVKEGAGHRILITEDNDDLRRYITRLLERMGHITISAENGQAALDILHRIEGIDLIVTDIMMPKMDGYELLKTIRGEETLRDLPVIMITAKAGDDPKLMALGIGADDYLPKPINVRELDARIRNLLTARDLHRAAANAAVLDQRIEDLRLSFAQALSIRDAETATHSREVLEIGTLIAMELGLQIDQTLKDSLLLHDIGKIGIPDNILLKKTSLDEEEMKVMERHAEIGKELLEGFSNFKDVSNIILAHQEHWDGSGYPRGLAGEQIPLIARIIAVADAYHAMTNTRPYRDAMSREDAMAELRKNSGSQFDPSVVEAFLRARGLA